MGRGGDGRDSVGPGREDGSGDGRGTRPEKARVVVAGRRAKGYTVTGWWTGCGESEIGDVKQRGS